MSEKKKTTMEGYVVFDRDGLDRLTKTMPRLGQGQHAIKIRLVIPDELFKRMIPECEINVETTHVAMPPPEQVEIAVPSPVIGEEEPDA